MYQCVSPKWSILGENVSLVEAMQKKVLACFFTKIRERDVQITYTMACQKNMADAKNIPAADTLEKVLTTCISEVGHRLGQRNVCSGAFLSTVHHRNGSRKCTVGRENTRKKISCFDIFKYVQNTYAVACYRKRVEYKECVFFL
jgi:hypothetical protein